MGGQRSFAHQIRKHKKTIQSKQGGFFDVFLIVTAIGVGGMILILLSHSLHGFWLMHLKCHIKNNFKKSLTAYTASDLCIFKIDWEESRKEWSLTAYTASDLCIGLCRNTQTISLCLTAYTASDLCISIAKHNKLISEISLTAYTASDLCISTLF